MMSLLLASRHTYYRTLFVFARQERYSSTVKAVQNSLQTPATNDVFTIPRW
jgi:hypothetical protein